MLKYIYLLAPALEHVLVSGPVTHAHTLPFIVTISTYLEKKFILNN